MKTFLFIFMLNSCVFGQSFSISGNISTIEGNPIVGANLLIKGSLLGTASNLNGEYLISKLEHKPYNIIVSMLGYKTIDTIVVIKNKSEVINFILKLSDIRIDQVVVSAGKHYQDIEKLPVSAEIVGSDKIIKKNFTKVDDILRFVPGVSMTLDQVSIRGSSGYSRGAGTRVLVAYDGIPLYTGDSGEIVWEIIPPSEISRVEIIKGASSSLYGSSAIGGVVNIISRDITSKPLTIFKSYIGAYDNPSRDEWKWSNKIRSFNGISITHSNTIDNLGFTVSLSRKEDQSYRKNDWQKRYGFYLKTKYNFNPNIKLTFFTSGFFRNRETFNFWKDSRNALLPPDSDIDQRLPSERFILGSDFIYKFNNDFQISFKPSYYKSFWKDESESSNNSHSHLVRNEIQTNLKIASSSLLVSGLEYAYGSVRSNIFGNRISNLFGVYSQLEHTMDFPLTVTIGARFDWSKLDNKNPEYSFSPKIGLNFKLNKSTILRSSFGKGFRTPTLAEAFTSTTTSGLTVKPNPDIISESTINFELGIKKYISSVFSLDVAFFNNEYFDMIEPIIDPLDGQITFRNLTRSRIQGMETVIQTKLFNFDLSFGYTYLWARDLEMNKALKYRPRNLTYISLDYNYLVFSIGSNFRYWSRVEEVDDQLINFVQDGDKRVEVMVMDIYSGIKLYKFGIQGQVNLNINNIFNYNYVEMIGNIAPIRNISVNLELLF